MSELIQLTDTELDAVCGGILDFANVVAQANHATNTSANVLSVTGETEQNVFQANTSLIGSAIVI